MTDPLEDIALAVDALDNVFRKHAMVPPTVFLFEDESDACRFKAQMQLGRNYRAAYRGPSLGGNSSDTRIAGRLFGCRKRLIEI